MPFDPRRLRSFALAVAAGAVAGCATPPDAAPFEVRLIAFNDFHGHLQSPGRYAAAATAAGRPEVGGADALAAQVARLRDGHPLNAVVAAGDLVGASPPVSALFADEPAVEALNRIGLEFSAVGNHEFDHGTDELLRLQRGGCRPATATASCRGAEVGLPVPFEGARFQWLAANVVSRADGRPLLPPYAIKAFRGVPVAFVGMTLHGTPGIVRAEGVAGLDFRDEAETVNALLPRLRAEGAEAVVVLLHQGGEQTGAEQSIGGCAGGLVGSALAEIVARLDDAVDLVVSGHTHAAYVCTGADGLPNRAGRRVPVTSAASYGRVLTAIDLTLDPRTRDVVAVRAANRLVARDDPLAPPDPALAALVQAYARRAAPVTDRVVGAIASELSNRPTDAACNVRAGELVADAQLAATASPAAGGARIAFANRGGLRTGLAFASGPAGEGDGQVTYGEAFAAQPFGNALVTMTLTARELKDALEQQFAGCLGQDPQATRLLLPSAGLRVRWDGRRPCGARITGLTLEADGRRETLVDEAGALPEPERAWRVTVNDFLAAGGDGFGAFRAGRDRVTGAQDIDALVAYLGRFLPPAPAYEPATPERGLPRITRAGATSGRPACPGGNDTNP
jgi:5'-nucleotidase